MKCRYLNYNIYVTIVTNTLQGVETMKQKLLMLSQIVILGGCISLGQPVFADETIPEVKTEATKETSSDLKEPVEESKEVPKETTEESAVIPESSVSNDEAQKVVEDVEALIKEQVGEAKEIDPSLFNTTTGEGIRAILSQIEYKMTESELSGYSDEQLLTTMTLYERYNYDIIGMDMSSYVRVLRGLYGDKSLSWESISQQLSFVPNNFNSFAEMIPRVDELQAYLKALYPSGSSFMPIKSVSNEELIAVLTDLKAFENKFKEDGESLPAGRIALIKNRIDNGMETSASSTPTSDSKKTDEGGEPLSSAKKEDSDKGNLLKLPQTGEEKAKWAISVVGILIVLGAIIFVIKRNKMGKTN